MSKTNSKLTAFTLKIDNSSFKSRAVILFISLLLIYVIWFAFILMPVQKRIKQSITQIHKTKENLSLLENKIIQISTEIMHPKDTIAFKELVKLRRNSDALSTQFKPYAGKFAPAEGLVLSLKTKLEQQPNLTLISLKNPPPRTLYQSYSQKIVQHDVELKFNGTYSGTLTFLQAMGRTKWHIFWDDLSYQVEKYPYANVVLKLHSLSYEQGKPA